MRKLLCVFLAVVMVFSLVGVMPISAFAETVEYSNRNKYETEYNIAYYSEGNSWNGTDKISKISSVEELKECTANSDILSKYDDAFFESQALIWIDTGTPDSSYSLRVVLVENSENEMFIVLNIEQTPNIEVPQEVCDWDIVLEVEKADIEKVVGIATDTLAPLPEETEPPMCWDGGSELVPPNKTVYTEGEVLDLTGLEFYGLSGIRYGDGTESISRMPIDNYTVDLAGKPLTVDDKIVTVTGRHPTMGVEEKQTFEITVNPIAENYPYEVVDIALSNYTEVDEPSVNEALNVYVTIKKTEECETDGCLFLALYDANGALMYADNVQLKFGSSSGSKGVNFYSIQPFAKSIAFIKAYVWDGVDSMAPLSLSKTWDYSSVTVGMKTLADNSVDLSVSSKTELAECKIVFPESDMRWNPVDEIWDSYKADAVDVNGTINIKKEGVYILYTKDKNGEEKYQYVYVDIPVPKVTIAYTEGETQATFDVNMPNNSAKLEKLAVVYEEGVRVGDFTNANESWKHYAYDTSQSTELDLNNPVFDVSVDGYYTVVAIDEWGNIGVDSVQVGDPWAW